jgi:hypothetical protein
MKRSKEEKCEIVDPSLKFINERSCGLIECCMELHHSQGVVVVAVDESALQRLKSLKRPPESFIKWDSGRIVFHKSCWDTLKDLNFSMNETNLLNIGKETAEYYDNEKVSKQVELCPICMFL